jgi:murein DD-endopeptidase MepM/ murein hydrolase activator NlpD
MMRVLRAARGLMIVALVLGWTGQARADVPAFGLPVACDMAGDCSIQKYVDHDPGPDRLDYACGRLSKDGDHGTDFRVRDLPAMRRGIPVVAAAPGIVKAARDGMPDVSVREAGPETVRGREAGNGVVIDHGDGWETQYSHLKQGSVRVRAGDQVSAGQQLGLIGLSGNTEFPHVEFSVRHQGRPIDPFVGTAEPFACGGSARPLWSTDALAALPYRASGALIAGFAAGRPVAETAREGGYGRNPLPAAAPALVFWADVWGAMAGDVQRFRIRGPDGAILHRHESVLKESNISWFAFSGIPRPPKGFRPGRYEGAYELVRAGQPVAAISESIEISD